MKHIKSAREVYLQFVVGKARQIIDAHEEGAWADAGFDAGEFSGPAHDRMVEKEIRMLAAAHGFAYEEVMHQIDGQ